MSKELMFGDTKTPELLSGIAEFSRDFQALADEAPEMMWRFGADGECKFFNRRWLEYRGRTAKQECGAGWIEGVHPEDLERCVRSYRSAFEARQPFHLEFRIRRADKSYAWIRAHGVPQYLLDGRFVGYVGSLEESMHEAFEGCDRSHIDRQTSDAAAALCALPERVRRSRGRFVGEHPNGWKHVAPLSYDALLECLDIAHTPIVVIDRSGQAIYCNRPFRSFLANNNAPGDWASKMAKSLKSSAHKRKIPEKSALLILEEVQAWVDHHLTTAQQDRRISVESLAIGGERLTVFAIDGSRDDGTVMLEQVFLHDLINATGSIQMLVDLLTGETSTQEQAEYLKLLQLSLNRLVSEIHHEKLLLDNTGSMPSFLDVHEVLTTLARSYQGQAFARQCRIEVHKGSVESAKLPWNQTLLVRILDNMLRNAVGATAYGGVVTLGCRRVNRELDFWVHYPSSTSKDVRTKIGHRSIGREQKESDLETPEIKLLSSLCRGTVAVATDQTFGTTYSIRYPAGAKAFLLPKKAIRRNAS